MTKAIIFTVFGFPIILALGVALSLIVDYVTNRSGK